MEEREGPEEGEEGGTKEDTTVSDSLSSFAQFLRSTPVGCTCSKISFQSIPNSFCKYLLNLSISSVLLLKRCWSERTGTLWTQKESTCWMELEWGSR